MANETPQPSATESLIHPEVAESNATAQPTQSVTAPSVRKTKSGTGKRGRPRKNMAPVPITTTSLTRTTRRISKPRQTPKAAPAPAPHTTLLNRLVNISVVAAVFVTALAIQRIVPTETVPAPKVEALPAQAAATPVPTEPSSATASAPASPTTSPPAPASAQASAPAPTEQSVAAASPTPQQVPVAKPKTTKIARPTSAASAKGHSTSLNSGGTEDLDSEGARQSYLAKGKQATRTPTK